MMVGGSAVGHDGLLGIEVRVGGGLVIHFLQVAVNTVIQDEKEFLDHIIKSTNMKCLTPM